ncbi:MAG: hypothetical protein ACREJC_02280 [Tepidisphaeraceae bacterium]
MTTDQRSSGQARGGQPPWLAMAIVLAVVAIVTLPWSARLVATYRAFHRNLPQIVLGGNLGWTQRDASTIVLSDGRVCRLVDVVPAEVASADGMNAGEVLSRVMHRSPPGSLGLRVIGTNANREWLVQLWCFAPSQGGCGNGGYFERWHSSIPRWERVGWMLVNSGLYRAPPDAGDPEILGWQEAAIDAATGAWADPQYARAHLDLKLSESYFDRQHDQHTNYDRMRIARRLLRIDPAKYAPMFLLLVKDASDGDAFFRAMLAQTLNDFGAVEGTDYLMEGLRGKRELGVARTAIADEYARYWNLPVWGDPQAIIAHYDSLPRHYRR